MSFDPHRVIFLGHGSSAVCYYRCALPAKEMGADWVGIGRVPPNIEFVTGEVRDPETGKMSTMKPRLIKDNYDIVVLQQVSGGRWAKLIKWLQEQGIKVFYEIDDYLHGIAQQDDHQWQAHYDPRSKEGRGILSDIEWCMKRCDGLIVSTEFIADQYRHFNKNVHVCRNGIDLARYNLTKPERKSRVNIGWAGSTGHVNAASPWLMQVARIMDMRANVNFVSVGRVDFANAFKERYPDERVIGVPWAAMEQYPSAMTMFDIALAPAGKTPWWRGKSDLRWLEASALGIPVVADPEHFPEIEDGQTGLWAPNVMALMDVLLMLVDDPGRRKLIGRQAKEYVTAHRGMDTMVKQWEEVFSDALD